MLLLWSWAPLFLLLAWPAGASSKEGLNILGGEDVAANEYDYVVGLSIRQKNSRTAGLCSGSIINSQWILTAGHCVEGKNPSTHTVEVEVGAKRLSESHSIMAQKWFTHERYRHYENPTRVFYDIALVKVQDSVLRIRNTALAVLPSSENDDPRRGSTVEVVGFGVEGEGSLSTTRRGVLKKANMSVQGICSNTFPYCIKANSVNGRACPGDSGGPMVYRGRVVGVSSTGRTCTERRGDAQYTRVSKYLSWISDKIRQG